MVEEATVVEIELPQVRLSALTWGPADGPLAVCLHGFPDTAWTWRHLGPALAADGWRVVAPFTRGYGPSEVPADGDYHVGALMSDAAAIHEVLGGDERAVLVGHDWGAMTAHGLGAHAGSPYSRIVSLAVPPAAAMQPPTVGTRRLLSLLPGQVRRSWYILYHQLPLLPERLLHREVRKLWADWSPGYDATTDLAHLDESLATPSARAAAIGYYRAMVRPTRPLPVYRDWQSSTFGTPVVPTLSLHGRDDGCLGVGLTTEVAEVLPEGSAHVVVDGAGHFLQLERPAEVNRLIREFVGPA